MKQSQLLVIVLLILLIVVGWGSAVVDVLDGENSEYKAHMEQYMFPSCQEQVDKCRKEDDDHNALQTSQHKLHRHFGRFDDQSQTNQHKAITYEGVHHKQ